MKLIVSLIVLCGLAGFCQAEEQVPDWRPYPGYPDYMLLYEGDRVVGHYRISTDQYWPKIGNRVGDNAIVWGNPGRCPVAAPGHNFGVMPRRIRGGEHYTAGGQEVGREEAIRLVSAPSIPDSSSKLRVVAVGPDQARIVQDLSSNPLFSPWRDKAIVQGFDAGAWQVANVGYGQGVTVTDPTGKQLVYQQAYDVQALAEGLRKADPNYTPTPTPVPGPTPAPDPWLPHVHLTHEQLFMGGLFGLILAVGFGIYFVCRNTKL